MPLRVQAIQKETWKEPTSLCCIVANKFASVEKYIQFPLVCVGAFIIYLTHTYEISEAHTCEFLCLFKGNIFSCNFFFTLLLHPCKNNCNVLTIWLKVCLKFWKVKCLLIPHVFQKLSVFFTCLLFQLKFWNHLVML